MSDDNLDRWQRIIKSASGRSIVRIVKQWLRGGHERYDHWNGCCVYEAADGKFYCNHANGCCDTCEFNWPESEGPYEDEATAIAECWSMDDQWESGHA